MTDNEGHTWQLEEFCFLVYVNRILVITHINNCFQLLLLNPEKIYTLQFRRIVVSVNLKHHIVSHKRCLLVYFSKFESQTWENLVKMLRVHDFDKIFLCVYLFLRKSIMNVNPSIEDFVNLLGD